MRQTLNLAILISLFTAVIGIALWTNGYPPPREGLTGFRAAAYPVISSPLFFAGLGLLIAVPCIILKRDILDQAKSKARFITQISTLSLPLLMLVMQVATALESYGILSDRASDLILLVAVAIMFALIGNYAAIQPFGARGGFRNRWTLSGENVWAKAHRMLGKAVMAVAVIVTPIAAIIDLDHALNILVISILLTKLYIWDYSRRLAQSHAEATNELSTAGKRQ